MMGDGQWTLEPEIDAFMATIEMPPQPFMDQLAAERALLESVAPKPGEPAPLFSAQRISASGDLSSDWVSLEDFRGHNFALVFGSYTCPIYRGQTERFNSIYAELQDRLKFLLIYTREAHPRDGWQVVINETHDVIYDQPTTIEGRATVANDCIVERGIRMPVALDDMQDSIDKLYAGAPERLYLIAADGIVRHRSAPGPFQLDEIDAWHNALRAAT